MYFWRDIEKELVLAAILLLIMAMPVQATNWQTVTTITGSSNQTTDYFRIEGTEWRISWSYTPQADYQEYATFSFFAYPKGETALYVTSLIKTGAVETSGTTYVHEGPGHYYLVINVANLESYSITVEYNKDSVPEPPVPAPGTDLALIGAIILVVAVATGILYVTKLRKRSVPPK